MIPSINREPQTELKEQRALMLSDCVYFFNHLAQTVSTYTIYPEGFTYSVTGYLPAQFIGLFNTVYLNANKNGFRSKELTPAEFTEFVNQIAVLQEQSHALKPLVSFDDYINILLNKMGLKLK